MIILTNRLKAIADNVEKGEKVADIGTDHGYLPLFLKEQGISPHVILIDISKGSLAKAGENAKRLFPGEIVDLRLSDGLDALEKAEVDTVVMAGIGGNSMVEILDWDLGKSISFNKYILQPRNNCGAVRRYLFEHGFETVKIEVAPEDRRYCEIMTVLSPKTYNGRINSSDIPQVNFDFPEELAKDEMSRNYISGQLELEETILSNIIAGRGEIRDSDYEKDANLKTRRDRIDRLNYLLSM